MAKANLPKTSKPVPVIIEEPKVKCTCTKLVPKLYSCYRCQAIKCHLCFVWTYAGPTCIPPPDPQHYTGIQDVQ